MMLKYFFLFCFALDKKQCHVIFVIVSTEDFHYHFHQDIETSEVTATGLEPTTT